MVKKVEVTPLHDRVIVQPAPSEEKTAGGIITPDTAKEKPQMGVVIAVGPGKKDEPVTVKNSRTMSKQLFFELDACNKMKRGVDLLANAVKVTLGPKGRNVVIEKKFGAAAITKELRVCY